MLCKRILLLVCLAVFLGCSNSQPRVIQYRKKEPTREELRKAMRYHGILFARQDESGEWYFLRDGKRCRLFAYQQRT